MGFLVLQLLFPRRIVSVAPKTFTINLSEQDDSDAKIGNTKKSKNDKRWGASDSPVRGSCVLSLGCAKPTGDLANSWLLKSHGQNVNTRFKFLKIVFFCNVFGNWFWILCCSQSIKIFVFSFYYYRNIHL